MNGQGKRVTIYINNTDQWHHRPLYLAILELLCREGCAGATVTQGVAGFGGSRRINVAGLVDVVMDVPLVVTWIDRPERVKRVLPQVAEMVTVGLITVQDLQIYQYAANLRAGFPEVRVEEVMTRTVITIHPEAPIVEAVEKLVDKDYTALPVVDAEHHVVGIISDTDLLERGDMEVSLSLKKAADPHLVETLLARLRQSTRTVAHVMTPEPVTIGPQANLSEAAHIMSRHKLKRLPVVGPDKRLLGVVGRLDILTALAARYLPQEAPHRTTHPHLAHPRTVADVMDTTAPTVSPTTPLTEVLTLLASARVKRVVVVDADRRVVGIISDSDVIARMDPETHPGLLEQLVSKLPLGVASEEARAHLQRARGKTAADLMTRDVVTVTAEAPIDRALALSADTHIKRLPVVDGEGKLLGLVGRTALLSALVEEPERQKEE
jgi:CBS-domain-containing membrane protein